MRYISFKEEQHNIFWPLTGTIITHIGAFAIQESLACSYIYRRNWIISVCSHGVNSRALYAYIREWAYNAVIFDPHPFCNRMSQCDEDDLLAS